MPSASGFPPTVLYPSALDSDFTLFLVYNTTETQLTVDNDPWASEILINAQPAGALEIWAGNGFANLSGELLYYDSVDTDINGHVYRLKRCLRNLGGSPPQYNRQGTWIRGFVIAEHHTQIVNCILQVEQFIGIDFSPISATLDWRIRHLFAEPIIFDDFGCPDLNFAFNIISGDPNTGVLANYAVTLNGSVATFQIQFGDGTTTTAPQGTHQYAPNATVDPVVIVTSQNCQIVQTPLSRDEIAAPTVAPPPQPFALPIPIPFDLPPIFLPSIPIPSSDIFIPAIQFPCIDLSPLSNISFGNITIPSIIIPGLSTISVNVPNISLMVPTISISPISVNSPSFSPVPFGQPPTISFGQPPSMGKVSFGQPPSMGKVSFSKPPSFSPISFATAPVISFGQTPIFAKIQFAPAPTVSVNWGTPPTCSCTVICPGIGMAAAPPPRFGMDRDYGFDNNEVEVQYDMVGFPTEIKVIPPHIPPIEVKHEIPNFISLHVPKFENISIVGPTLPHEIKIVAPEKGIVLDVISFNIPKIKMDFSDMPLNIPIAFPKEMPRIAVDMPESIKVVGIPETISVSGIPDHIDIRIPSDVRIPVFFDGPPLSAEVKIVMDIQKLMDEDGSTCVKIVPCTK